MTKYDDEATQLNVFSNVGVNDFLTKDRVLRQPLLLNTAIKNLLRPAQVGNIIATGKLMIDLDQHLATFAGQELDIKPTAFHVLSLLALNLGRWVTFEKIMDYCLKKENANESNVYNHISQLRAVIEPGVRPRYILSKVTVGYMLSAHPEDLDGEQS